MSDVLKAKFDFLFDGKMLSFAVPTYEIEQAFTNWLEMRAHSKIARRQKELVEAGTYLTNMTIWQNNVDTDAYDWAGFIADRSRQSEPGQKHLLWLMLEKCSQGTPVRLVDHIFADPVTRELLFCTEDGKPLGLYWRAVALGRPTSRETPTVTTPEQDGNGSSNGSAITEPRADTIPKSSAA